MQCSLQYFYSCTVNVTVIYHVIMTLASFELNISFKTSLTYCNFRTVGRIKKSSHLGVVE